jgi:hypothetical protein
MDSNKILNAIKTKYDSNKGLVLSIDYVLSKIDYALVVLELLNKYPSIQTNYNVGVNENKVHLTIGYI